MRIDIKGDIIRNDIAWIYDLLGYEYTSPKNVSLSLDKAKTNGEDVDVYINSGGGEIFAGSEIYSLLRNYEGEIHIHVVGIAASAASVIACAGKSDISPTAMMMVHNVSSSARGDYHQMDKESDVLKKANKAVAAAYVEKTGMTEQEALELMDKETWLTALEAVDLKIIDSISAPTSNSTINLAAAAVTTLSADAIEKITNLKNENVILGKKVERYKKLFNLKEGTIE